LKKEKNKKYNEYSEKIFIRFYKNFFKSILLNRIKKNNLIKRTDDNIENSSDVSNKVLIELKKNKNDLNIEKTKNYFMKGEINYFQKINKNLIELDKENFYQQKNNLKIKNNNKESIKEVINKYILDVINSQKIQSNTSEKNFIKKNSKNKEFELKNKKINQNNRLIESCKIKEQKNIIILLNKILNELNILFSL
jgi:hypothetical protein